LNQVDAVCGTKLNIGAGIHAEKDVEEPRVEDSLPSGMVNL
jgi:hypothetical protein